MSRARKTTARRRALDGTCARRSMCRVPIHTFAPLSIVDVGARAATSARRWSRERPPAQHVAGDVWEAGMQVRGAAHPERGAFGGAPEVGDTHGAESPALACGTPDASRPQRVGYPRAALTRRIGRVLAGESIPRRSAPQMTVLGAALRSRSRETRHTTPSRGTRLRARPAKSAAHGPDMDAYVGSVSTVVLVLVQVQHIVIFYLNEAALEHFGRLATLEFLVTMRFPASLIAREFSDAPMFPSHTLIVGPVDIESTTGFMAMCSGSPWTQWTLKWLRPRPQQTLKNSIQRSHASLTSFLFKGSGFYAPQTQRAAYVHPLSPLHRFANLTSVDIGSSIDPPRPTLQALRTRNHAGRLDRAARDRARPAQQIPTRFVVGPSPITAPLSVARFLSGIFAHLTDIATEWESRHLDADTLAMHAESIAVHRLWKDVERMLPELLAARTEERDRTLPDQFQ
ncbi:hypothetical protein B0H10DRAFT_2437225 [Mycena sp. CBHHK59/15]|nr:hypothetical protein B0H10DRAFT_2437225 [Mycena sp. CBHHK59/15]